MKLLLQKLSSYTLQDAFQIEKTDRQFQSLQKLHKNMKDDCIFLHLVLANATVWYMLSSSGEDYWEEFSAYFSKKNLQSHGEVIQEMHMFLPLSKGNKRLNQHKNSRLEKLSNFLHLLEKNKDLYQENILTFVSDISHHMNQKKDAKTITFSVKMMNYAFRIIKDTDIAVPFDISIPIDSRLTKLYTIHNTEKNLTIKEFYKTLSQKTNIPPIHLDGIIWTKIKDFLDI